MVVEEEEVNHQLEVVEEYLPKILLEVEVEGEVMVYLSAVEVLEHQGLYHQQVV